MVLNLTLTKKSEDGNLADAVLKLKSTNEVERFLRDICTPAEIMAISQRWEVAKLLDEGELSYRDIAEQTGASVTTVGRVARFLNQEPHQGYRTVLDRLKKA